MCASQRTADASQRTANASQCTAPTSQRTADASQCTAPTSQRTAGLAPAPSNLPTMPADGTDYTAQMESLLEQARAKGVRDPRVLQAMRQTPRHLFVPESHRLYAYTDHALPIGEGRPSRSRRWWGR
jgi:hypothetical protein